MVTKHKEGVKQYQSEMSQACLVIHKMLEESRYDLDIGGLVRYTPPKGVKTALYAMGLRPNTYMSGAKVHELDEAVHALLDNYEKLKAETSGNGNGKRKRRLKDLVKEMLYQKATGAARA